jgi:hypothetical protein
MIENENNDIERTNTSSKTTSNIFFVFGFAINLIISAIGVWGFITILSLPEDHEWRKDLPFTALSLILLVFAIVTFILRRKYIEKKPTAAAFITLFGLMFNAFGIVSAILLFVHSKHSSPDNTSNQFITSINNKLISSVQEYKERKKDLENGVKSGLISEDIYESEIIILTDQLKTYKEKIEESIPVMENQLKKGIISKEEYEEKINKIQSEIEEVNSILN